MADINTLVDDINRVLVSKEAIDIEHQILVDMATNVATNVQRQLVPRNTPRDPSKLHFSEIGKPCHRQVWYSIQRPELAASLSPTAKLNFMYGDAVEELALTLAMVAGHDVSKRQERVEYIAPGVTVTGRIDAVIDGVVVDVKSTTSFGFDKFDELTDDNDLFGYRQQLAGYRETLFMRSSAFLVVDKQKGGVKLSPSHEPFDINKMKTLARDVHSPVVTELFRQDVEADSNGDYLGTVCSYCSFKSVCWAEANNGVGIRSFEYAGGRVKHYVTLHKIPRLKEVTGEIT